MNNQSEIIETICAVATPAGRGGVSIVRISGPQAFALGGRLTGKTSLVNSVQYCSIRSSSGEVLDNGLVIFFKNPASFTGEDVVELQFHGSPVVADEILALLSNNGARLARPGEFSERAFLNNKLDLSQAEAIADLINSKSVMAAKYAIRSLNGELSRHVNSLVDSLTDLRIYVEAAIDFPEEEINFLEDEFIGLQLKAIQARLDELITRSRHGVVLNEGVKVIIIGEPNAGKSSLLNLLAGYDKAIVTDIPGTTRDMLDLVINIHGIPVQFIDSAGLRDSSDAIELEGIKRTRKAMIDAEVILLLIDSSRYEDPENHPVWNELKVDRELVDKTIFVMNKIDLVYGDSGHESFQNLPLIRISVLEGTGLHLLNAALLDKVSFTPIEEGSFLARRRHVEALYKAQSSVASARHQIEKNAAGDMAAEDLRYAQGFLGEITGKISSDDLLGKIFSSFCIGK